MDWKSKDVGKLVGRNRVVRGWWMGMECGWKKWEEKVGGSRVFVAGRDSR